MQIALPVGEACRGVGKHVSMNGSAKHRRLACPVRDQGQVPGAANREDKGENEVRRMSKWLVGLCCLWLVVAPHGLAGEPVPVPVWCNPPPIFCVP